MLVSSVNLNSKFNWKSTEIKQQTPVIKYSQSINDTVAFTGVKQDIPADLMEYLKKLEPVLGNIKELNIRKAIIPTYDGTITYWVEYPSKRQDAVLKLVEKINKKYNDIVLNATPNNIKKFLEELILFDIENPFRLRRSASATEPNKLLFTTKPHVRDLPNTRIIVGHWDGKNSMCYDLNKNEELCRFLNNSDLQGKNVIETSHGTFFVQPVKKNHVTGIAAERINPII